jgi:hypothetical protein
VIGEDDTYVILSLGLLHKTVRSVAPRLKKDSFDMNNFHEFGVRVGNTHET